MTDVGVHVLPQPVEHRTYYTLAGITPVLVHNAGSDCIPGYETMARGVVRIRMILKGCLVGWSGRAVSKPYASGRGALGKKSAPARKISTIDIQVTDAGIGIGVKALMALMVEGNSVEIPLNHIPIRIRRR